MQSTILTCCLARYVVIRKIVSVSYFCTREIKVYNKMQPTQGYEINIDHAVHHSTHNKNINLYKI